MEYKSIMTDDLEHCFICGRPYPNIHHMMNGANKKKYVRIITQEPRVFIRNPKECWLVGKWHKGNLKRIIQEKNGLPSLESLIFEEII